MNHETPYSLFMLGFVGPTWPQGRPQQHLNNNLLLLRCFSGYKVLQIVQHKPRKAQHGPDMQTRAQEMNHETSYPLFMLHFDPWDRGSQQNRVPLDRAFKNVRSWAGWLEQTGFLYKVRAFSFVLEKWGEDSTPFSKARWSLNFKWFCTSLKFIEAQCHAGATHFELYSDGLRMFGELFRSLWL